jgi:hypothetical protein
MSLVRLLTAGKSLVGIQDSKSRYRSVDPRAMPTFGSEKKVNTDVARESEVKPSVTKLKLENSKAVVTEKSVPSARKAGGSGWVSQWGSKLSSLVSQKPKPARSAIPRFIGVPVQGELSLDNIKVVRNDLSDADVEVVMRQTTPKKNATPTHVSESPARQADRNRAAAPEQFRAMLGAANP